MLRNISNSRQFARLCLELEPELIKFTISALNCSTYLLKLGFQISCFVGFSSLISLGGNGVPWAIAAPQAAPIQQTTADWVSQTPRGPQGMQQGSQVILNGRTLPAAWAQWQMNGITRTGISDLGLLQIAGVELLNTNDRAQQPIQWFSASTTNPLTLATRVTGPFRYLDITEFARKVGWQLQVSGSGLKIASPVAKVLAIRHAQQPWGDRLVLDVDRPVTWQVDQQSQELVLTLQAQTDPALPSTFKPSFSNQVKSFKLESAPNQTQLRLGIPITLRPRIWSLPNPNRLIVDIRPDSQVDQNILWANGLRWRRQTFSLGTDRFPVTWLEIDPRQSGVRLQPILPNSKGVVGIAPLAQTAQQSQVSAAINGGFFNRNNQLPLGALRQDNRWLSGPILNRGAIAWNAAGEFKVGRLTLQETLVTQNGQRLAVSQFNSAYPEVGIARYTSDWGSSYTPLTNNEILISVQNNRVVSQQTIATSGSSSVAIPTNGYLLAVRANPAVATALGIGTSLSTETATNPPEFGRYPQIVAAGPLLIQAGQIVLNPEAEKFSKAFAVERASRSAIGQLANGTIILVAVHNRVNGVGASLTEMAQLMQQLGAVNALNLDGGSSTTLYLGGQLIDRLPRTAARVHNGIGVFVQPNP